MAEKRMFAKKITESDAFLDMPMSTQALYFHLNMTADDDGFVNNPKRTQRMVNASDDDMKLLMLKNFVITFDSGLVVIKHWRIHNYIQSDRYNPTNYKKEKSMLKMTENKTYEFCDSKMYTGCIQDVYTDKIRLDKISIDKNINTSNEVLVNPDGLTPKKVIELFNEICKSFGKVTKLSEKRTKAIKARINFYNKDDFVKLFETAEASDFLKGKNKRNWTATFDWLMCDANFAKVIDGNYSNRDKCDGASDSIGRIDLYEFIEQPKGESE